MRPLRSALTPLALAALTLLVSACGSGGEGSESGTTSGSAEVLSADALRGRLPQAVGSLPRTAAEGEVQSALGAEVAEATARYGAAPGEPRPAVVLTLMDLGTPEMVERMGYGWGLGTAEGAAQFEGYPAEVEEGSSAGHASVRVLVGERFLVEAVGEEAGVDAAQDAVRSVDLDALAELARQ